MIYLGSTMCDFLALCFSREYRAPKTLHKFMIESLRRGDVDGWGIGFFLTDRRCAIVKDVDVDARNIGTHRIFDLVSRCIESEIIIAHFRLASRKDLYGEKYAHPFKDTFLDADWLFAHNGSSRTITEYVSRRKIHHDHQFDSPRVFEFIRDEMEKYLSKDPTRGIFRAVKNAVEKLYETYEGTYNFVLANCNVLFVNLDGKHPYNDRLYILAEKKDKENKMIIVTTIRDLTKNNWIEIRARHGYRGKLLMFSEGEILHHEDI